MLHDLSVIRYSCPAELWNTLKSIITDVNDEVIPLICICQNSKPFWTKELSILSRSVQETKKRMNKRSTPSNIYAYKEAKEQFSNNLIAEKNNWIRCKLENLNVIESQRFWKNYKKCLVEEEKQYLGNLEKDGVIYTEDKDKEEVLFQEFFTGAHTDSNNYDTTFDDQINKTYQGLVDCQFSPQQADISASYLNEEITMDELLSAIKHQNDSAKSFDDNDIHPCMIKRLPASSVQIVMRIFNLCFSRGIWIWDTSNVIFL